MVRPVYDWPIPPRRVVIHAPRSIEEGRVSASGFDTTSFVFGSRHLVEMELPPVEDIDARLFSWLLDQGGTYFRVPTYSTPQVINFNQALPGILWGGDRPFGGGVKWKSKLTMHLSSSSLAGENTVCIDTSNYPSLLQHGHVFGVGFGVYKVSDIDYDAHIATVKTSTPLRRNVSEGEIVDLRPKIFCKSDDMSSLKGFFESARYATPGSIVLREVVDNEFL